MNSDTIQVKIIRHSERLDYTRPYIWIVSIGHYWSDSPLSTNGFYLADVKSKQLAYGNFKPKYIYTSPYIRTMQTAAVFKNTFTSSEIVVEPLLAEYQPSSKHNITIYPNGIPTTYDGKPTQFDYPESIDNFASRIQFIIPQLLHKCKSDVIIITHGEVLKTYISYVQNLFPEEIIEAGSVPYLTTLTFNYNLNTKTIDGKSIKIE